MTPTPTPTLFSVDAAKTLLESLPASIAEGVQQAYRMFWDALTTFLAAHWFLVSGVLVLVFVIAFIRAVMGGWGLLGKVLYRYIYFGILLIVGLIWGPEVLVGDVFSIARTLILYPLCYFMVGWALKKFGFRS